jgi:hypothetical protein
MKLYLIKYDYCDNYYKDKVYTSIESAYKTISTTQRKNAIIIEVEPTGFVTNYEKEHKKEIRDKKLKKVLS